MILCMGKVVPISGTTGKRKKLWIDGTDLRYIRLMSEKQTHNSLYKLREARKAAGLSTYKAATLVGCHRQTIVKLEAGETKLTEEWATKLGKAYGCTASELIGDGPILSRSERRLMELANEMTPQERDELLRVANEIRRRGLPKAPLLSEE